jgi:hypothetical protein
MVATQKLEPLLLMASTCARVRLCYWLCYPSGLGPLGLLLRSARVILSWHLCEIRHGNFASIRFQHGMGFALAFFCSTFAVAVLPGCTCLCLCEIS